MRKLVKILILTAVLSMSMAASTVPPNKETSCAHMSAKKFSNAIGIGPAGTNEQTSFRGAGASHCF